MVSNLPNNVRRTVPSRFWITENGALDSTKKPRAILPFGTGWIKVRRLRGRLTFVSERLQSETMNRISLFLQRYPRAGKTAKLVFLRPRRAQVTWPAIALSRRRYSERFKVTIDGLKEDVRRILPDCKPRKGLKSSPFFDQFRPWLERHKYLRTKEEYELLGADGGIVHDAVNTKLPQGFHFLGSPTVTPKEGAIIRLRCGRKLAWRTFFDRLDSYIGGFGHGNSLEEVIIERSFIRVPFMTSGRHGLPCVHCGELQVEGPGALKAVRDLRRAHAAVRMWGCR